MFGHCFVASLALNALAKMSGRRHHVEASMLKVNEWDLLKRQFDALVHDDSVAESIDEILDVQFRRRFTELINQIAQRNSTTIGYNWPRR